jgi:hypothetical protein
MFSGTAIWVARGARLHHFSQHLLLVRRVAFHGFNQVGDEVVAALILVQHLAPGSPRLLLQRRNGVDTAGGERRGHDQDG